MERYPLAQRVYAPGTKHYYWFAYHASNRETRNNPRNFFQVRDGGAFAEVTAPLCAAGYSYSDLLLNLPSALTPGQAPADAWPALGSSDLLVLVTRPPLHDAESGDRRSIRRSDTVLERQVFSMVQTVFFAYCTRRQVTLSQPLADSLAAARPHLKNRRNIEFRQHNGACYDKSWVAEHGEDSTLDKRTVAYLAYSPACWPQGPALLLICGMGGVETLIWAHMLHHHYPRLLHNVLTSQALRFLMSEWTIPVLSKPPTSLAFFDRCSATMLFAAESPLQTPPVWAHWDLATEG